MPLIPVRLTYSMNGEHDNPLVILYITSVLLDSCKYHCLDWIPFTISHRISQTQASDLCGFLSRFSRYSVPGDFMLPGSTQLRPLQCSIPAFKGLIPPAHDSSINWHLFRLSKWHVLAKLRIHTDDTLTCLQQSLQRLSDQLHHFQQDTCDVFDTQELPSEATQRQRKEMVDLNTGRRKKEPCSAPLPKTINLDTYKFHALGDYVRMIKSFSTTDSFTTQVVSLFGLL